MNTEVQNFLNDLKTNHTAIFDEFQTNKPNMEFEDINGVNVYMVKDIADIFVANLPNFPILTSLIPSNLTIMSLGFGVYDLGIPELFELRWGDNYPVRKYYISNTNTDNSVGTPVAGTDEDFPDAMNIMSVSGPGKLVKHDFIDASPDNTFIILDIWESSTPPTEEQQKNFFNYAIQSIITPSSHVNAYINSQQR